MNFACFGGVLLLLGCFFFVRFGVVCVLGCGGPSRAVILVAALGVGVMCFVSFVMCVFRGVCWFLLVCGLGAIVSPPRAEIPTTLLSNGGPSSRL